MASILIIYATTHGHTEKVAARMAEAIRPEGFDVDLRGVADAGEADPAGHAAAIVGASLHAGHHQREIVNWIKSHREALASRPSAFFSVSLTAADDTDEAREAAQACIDDLIDETGWKPTQTVAVAGALQYRKYDFPTRTLMRLMMRRDDHPTDTSRDFDYTDWDAVGRFGREFATLCRRQ